MKGRCIVISGGESGPLPEILEGDFIIACDRGGEYAARSEIPIGLLLGDFDSGAPEGEGMIAEEIRHYPTEKDDTDTMLAVRYALEEGYREMEICCALGGRLDHLYANLQAGAFATEKGCRVHMQGQGEEIFFIKNGQIKIPPKKGYSLSVFSYSNQCDGVCIRGTKYRMEREVLNNMYPMGVSNEWEDEAEISVEKGILMIILSDKSTEQAQRRGKWKE